MKLKKQNSLYKELSEEDDGLYYNGKVIEGYEDLTDRLDAVYMEVELYLNDGNIDTTANDYIETIKNKLIDSGLSEEISSAVVEGFSEEELDSIMNSDSIDLSQCLGLDDATAVIENIKKQLESVGNADNTSTTPLSITDTIDQLNTQLKPAFDSIQSAWEDIFTDDGFTLDNVDLSMLDSIKDSVDEINKVEGINIDYSAFETLAKILTDTASTEFDVKNGFNDFITEIVYGTEAMNNLNSSNAQLIETMLESLGVTNAHEIVYDSLTAKTEALALKEQLLSDTGVDLANATSDKVIAFLNQAGASETARNYLIKLIAEEQVFSNQDLDVSGKISKLRELAEAYGQTALAAKIAAQEKANEESHTVGSWSETDLQNFQKEWNAGLGSVTVDWSGINQKSSKSGSKSGSSSEKDLWLEEYKRKLKELENMRDKGKHKCPLL